jgi:phosphate acyltransferase
LARIALDAMGGDFAPEVTLTGALQALAELEREHTIQLVGQTDVVAAQLAELLRGQFASMRALRDRLEIVEAPEVVEMNDKPSVVIRGKPNSSMAVGLRLQPEGKSDAFVSAGNTGAQMAASLVLLRLHAGLNRPAIATALPSARHPVVLLDAGANVDCEAAELVQFARLGSVYAEDVLGRPNPGVGLLNIGEEAEKGNAAVKEAHQLLESAGVNFRGNVEGRDILSGANDHGDVDVVVCDGFVGNVVLKFYESVPPFILTTLRGAGIDIAPLQQAIKHLDYSVYGGAPLLGVNGVSIICHGNSSPRAIKNALKVAARAVESRMDEHIGRRLGESAPGEAA